MMKNWMQIFRAGEQTDSAGNTKTWTNDELDAIVKNYDPAKHEAPIVIGHPKTDAPAFGWVEALKREGDILYARAKQLVPEFVEMVRKGLFKKRSVAFYPDMTLRHVGFLGAAPPAIKGLEDVAFSDGEPISIEFEEVQNENTGGTKKMDIEKLKEEIIAKDKVLLEKDKTINQFAENERKNTDELKAANEKLAKIEAEKRKLEFNGFCDKLVKEDQKLSPAQKTFVMEFMEAIHNKGEYEFTEGKKNLLDMFKNFLNNQPKVIEFAETASKDKAAADGKQKGSEFSGDNVDQERLEMHNKAKEYAEKNKVSYLDAITIIMKDGI